ncbi:MAG: alcohol dehydrogenase catalytic domain-containing protein [Victivallaceae bacterium]
MKKKMAIFTGPGRNFRIESAEVAAPEPGMAGLQLLSSGICGTDVHIHQGFLKMPELEMILGHEFIGRIDQLGENAGRDALGRELAPGDRAVACVALPCGKCFNCLHGETASCLAFGVTYIKAAAEAPHFHGGFAEYLFSPATNLVKLPDAVETRAAAAFPCGGPTVIRACEYGGGLKKDEIVVIQGNGSLGLFALAYAKARGCTTAIIGSTANPERMELTGALTPDFFFDYRHVAAEEIARQIREFAQARGRGDGADVVIETSGAREALPAGLGYLRTRGRYLVPGQYSDRGEVAILPHLITFRALRIFGSGQYTFADIGAYLDFLVAHPELQKIFGRMVRGYRVEAADTAVADAAAGRAVKAVFEGA